MQNMESVQLIKEQLKIKGIELRKVSEENGRVTKKMKDLMAFNQKEVKKLKKVIKEKEETIETKDQEIHAARMSKVAAFETKMAKEGGKVTETSEGQVIVKDPNPDLITKIEDLRERAQMMKDRIEREKNASKKFQGEKGVLLKELKRLRQDSDSGDKLKERIEALKEELGKAKKTSMSSSGVTDEIVREKDALLQKYENMLYGDMDAGEEGMTPSEIIQELKEDVDALEKERKDMIVELEMLKEDHAEIEMKLTLLEDKKDTAKGGGGEIKRSSEGRGALAAEFGAGMEAFLVTYSDMITLLLVIFVLMFTVSKMDEERFAEALSSFQAKKMRIESVNVRLSLDEMKMLNKVRELVKDNVDYESLIRGDTRTILKRLPTADLFAPGQAILIDGAEELIIETIEEDMKEGVKQVLVDGHTDNVPMKSAKFPSNWELSSARASRVARFLIEKMRFPANQIVVSGYGEFRPLRPNVDDEARALNRRVELKILKDIKVAKREEAERKAAAEKAAPGQATPQPPAQTPAPANTPTTQNTGGS